MTIIPKFFLIFFEKADFVADCPQENDLFLYIHNYTYIIPNVTLSIPCSI